MSNRKNHYQTPEQWKAAWKAERGAMLKPMTLRAWRSPPDVTGASRPELDNPPPRRVWDNVPDTPENRDMIERLKRAYGSTRRPNTPIASRADMLAEIEMLRDALEAAEAARAKAMGETKEGMADICLRHPVLHEIRLVFADWKDVAGDSVYQTEAGVQLSMGSFHSGSVFPAEIRLSPDDAVDLRKALARGYKPVFYAIAVGREAGK